MSRADFDELIHAPLRLQICAMLSPVQWLSFSDIRDSLQVSDSVLSKHLSTLAHAGYLEVSRVRMDSRSRRRVALTTLGRRALRGHLAALQAIAAMAETTAAAAESDTPAPKRHRNGRLASLDPRTV
ncbi:MAG TPA: transcriptional regulator [Solirubrobacteraceae bacterium]|nr:transcriptional regulator [Solirubrobacteraceae bacterium]